MKSYYDTELQRLVPEKCGKGVIKIKLTDGENSTKWLDINLDSIESIKSFLDVIKEDLDFTQKKEGKGTDPCPECGYQLNGKGIYRGGGVECSNPKCHYWFCY